MGCQGLLLPPACTGCVQLPRVLDRRRRAGSPAKQQPAASSVPTGFARRALLLAYPYLLLLMTPCSQLLTSQTSSKAGIAPGNFRLFDGGIPFECTLGFPERGFPQGWERGMTLSVPSSR